MDLIKEIAAKYEEIQNNCQKRKESMEEVEQIWHHVFNHPKLSRQDIDKIDKLKAKLDLLNSDKIRISWIALELLKNKVKNLNFFMNWKIILFIFIDFFT